MINTLKRLLVSPLVALLLVFAGSAALVPATAGAQSVGKDAACEAIGGCNQQASEGAINTTIENIINIFSIVVGIVAVVMIILGGFKFITSGGDANNVKSAKNTILYAVIGLVVVALAQIIVRFVLNQTT